jgi:hypothetical protein
MPSKPQRIAKAKGDLKNLHSRKRNRRYLINLIVPEFIYSQIK